MSDDKWADINEFEERSKELQRVKSMEQQLETLRAERDKLKDQVSCLREALTPFARFYSWLKACEEIGAFENPLQPHDCITSMSCGGGSDYIWFKDLESAHKALIREGRNQEKKS